MEEGNSAISSRKSVPFVRFPEQPQPVLDGIRKRAPDMTEQLTFQELVRYGSAIDRN